MYKNGFGINNLQWLICHQTKPNQTLSATSWICFHSWEHGLRIHAFEAYLTLSACQSSCNPASGYCMVMNCTFTFCTTNVFGFFHSILAQFKQLINFPNYTTLHVSLWLSNAQCVSSPTTMILPWKSSWIRFCCKFISVDFNLHMKWRNAQFVSSPTTMILPRKSYWIRLCDTFICVAFNLQIKWSNALCLSSPTTMILRLTAWTALVCLSLPPTWQDLIQGFFIVDILEKGEVRYKTHALPPTWQDLIQGFFIVDILEKGEVRYKTHALLVYTDHRLTRWNVSQMTQLVLDSLNITWVSMPAHGLN